MTLPWSEIALCILTLVLLVSSGWIIVLKRELKELFQVVEAALEDQKITQEELAQIMKEAKDVGEAVMNIANLIQRR